jgi:hypothetical protein
MLESPDESAAANGTSTPAGLIGSDSIRTEALDFCFGDLSSREGVATALEQHLPEPDFRCFARVVFAQPADSPV